MAREEALQRIAVEIALQEIALARQTFVDVTVRLGRDVTIYPGSILQGDTVVGNGTDIGPHTQLDSCTVGAGSVVRHTVGVAATGWAGPWGVEILSDEHRAKDVTVALAEARETALDVLTTALS